MNKKCDHSIEDDISIQDGYPAITLYSLHFNGHFSRWTWVSRYQNVSILDFIGARDDGGGGDNWSYKMCKLQSDCLLGKLIGLVLIKKFLID